MIGGLLDVLFVSGADLPELDELGADGLTVERAPTFVSGVGRLRAGRASLVIAGSDVCSGRERDTFACFREAGASSVLAVYPPHLAWRAPRALNEGADDAVVLPAEPGTVRSRVMRLVKASEWAAHQVTHPSAPTPANGSSRSDRTMESLVGDLAVVNRCVGDLDRLLDQVLHVFSTRSAAERCSLMLVDERSGELHVRRAVGLPADAPSAPVPLGQGLAGHVAKTGLPLLVADMDLVKASLGRSPVERGSLPYSTRSCLILPLRAPRGVIGVVCLADKRSRLPFDDADLGPLRFLADQVAQSIENALQFRQMQDLAAIDELTGLANRRQFQRSLEREIHRARRYDRQVTLAMFDVDHFKKYNDTCGHQAGDRALATIGEILRTSLRDVDIVARYGGEEFAVILPETAARPGAPVSPFPFLERLRRRIEEAVFPGEEKLPGGRLTVSGGVASFPDDAQTLEDLIRTADEALYVSKARGRNRITYRGSGLVE